MKIKMKNFYKYLFGFALLISLSTCKKYDEGGRIHQTVKNLFGGGNVGDTKTWKLKLYEVNGVDSTLLIPGANTIPDFYEKYITFKLTDAKYVAYQADTYLYRYQGEVDKTFKQITVAITNEVLSHEDSSQCKIIQTNLFCSRNIMFPEFNNHGKLWDIKKLTKSEFIITIKLNNSYKIIFSR